jgi:hypothetical protein
LGFFGKKKWGAGKVSFPKPTSLLQNDRFYEMS